MSKRILFLAGASALASWFVGAPIAADIIAYKTEDGVYAYTDDQKNVPTRYSADAVTVRDSSLQTYPRLTVEDTAAAREVSSRLEKRLDYLRQANAVPTNGHSAATAGSATMPQNTVLTLPANGGEPSIQVGANGVGGPVVVDNVLSKQDGRLRTRNTTVVKKDGKVLAIVKDHSPNIDISSDIYDEDALEHGR